jgi:hypothetical protein
MDDHLSQALRLLEDARDLINHFVGSSYCETDEEVETFADEIDRFLASVTRT